MRAIAFPLLSAIALAGCAATPEEMARSDAADARQMARIEKKLAGYVPGEPQSCVNQSLLRSSDQYGQTILYQQGTSTYYRNDASPGCRLGQDDILVTQTPTGQLCRGDIVRTVDRTAGFMTGSCSLGEFVPYRRASRSGGN
ncbi:hypothetical protein OKW76_08870 [Sphingomonas sp. S1-29]|uniref:hypothetical protein n=1 Tax=Sphingomonas sp. S1-29 TaxID=2991074 RepID=UPI00223F5079|nr:hypothetical protein [Sphingomonas sp. S1-29]UZK68187.1 hypothetical protein OKW76_08870 [Sphingomonas sp. S1-29]